MQYSYDICHGIKAPAYIINQIKEVVYSEINVMHLIINGK